MLLSNEILITVSVQIRLLRLITSATAKPTQPFGDQVRREFYVAQFPIGTSGITLDRAIRWGAATDTAIEGGDYDGDGKVDYTVVRRNADNTITWFIKNSTTGTERAVNFGSVAGLTDFIFFPALTSLVMAEMN